MAMTEEKAEPQRQPWHDALSLRRRGTDATPERSAEQLDRAITSALARLAEHRLDGERRRHLAYAPDAGVSPIPAPMPARILVVDDEAMIRHLMTSVLTMAGYAVESAKSGAAALDRLMATAGAAEAIDLVITDTRMPGMSGWELIRGIRARWPAQRVLRISGFADAAGADAAGLDPATVPFLPKPFLPEELVRHVTLVLGR